MSPRTKRRVQSCLLKSKKGHFLTPFRKYTAIHAIQRVRRSYSPTIQFSSLHSHHVMRLCLLRSTFASNELAPAGVADSVFAAFWTHFWGETAVAS